MTESLQSPPPLRVLVVARWYPSHDDPSRGRFVADHVAALTAAGVDVVVASFEPVFVRRALETRPERAAEARRLWGQACMRADAANTPRAWGAAVPVARLPVVLDQGVRTDLEEIEAHAEALEPFAEGLADRWPFDIVHAHTGLPDGMASLRVARRLGRPVVVTEHASTLEERLADPPTRAAYRELVSGATVLAVGGALARSITRAVGVAEGAIGVLPNPVDVEAFRSSPADNAERDEHELLYVGNRKPSKGIEVLLRAFAEVRSDRPELRLRLIGRSPEPEDEMRWLDLARGLGIAGAMSFEPPAPRDGVAAAMRRAAAFVHPSPRETFGVVAAEALAAGLPVASAPSDGVVEILGTSGDYGEVASSPDAGALAAAIRHVLDRRASFRPDVLARRALDYSPASIAERSIDVYRSAIGDGDEQGQGRGERRGDAHDPGRRERRDDDVLPSLPGTTPARTLVVGLSRPDAASRVAAIPSGLVASLTVVTSRPGSGGPAALPAVLPPGPRWIEIDPDAIYMARLARLPAPLPPGSSAVRRALAFLRHPRAVRARRRLFDERTSLRAESLTAGLLEAWRTKAQGTRDGDSGIIVAVDADDALDARPLLAAGAQLAPGSVRWLVDRWDAAGAGNSGPVEDDAGS